LKKTVQKKNKLDATLKINLIERYAGLIVFAISFLLYINTLSFDFTYLDDTIFVRDFKDYHQFSNFFTFFKRGLFDATNDSYYRPLLSLSFTVDTFLGGGNFTFFHFSNVLMHALSAFLIYTWLKKEFNDYPTALAMSVLFAVHPAFVQVAAWIPGRNDALLMLFFMIHILQLQLWLKDKLNWRIFIIALSLLLTFFTKETAYFIPFITALYLWMHREDISLKSLGILSSTLIVAIILFFVIRSKATLKYDEIGIQGLFENAFRNFPVLFQYIGKVLMPFNLTVFPTMQNTEMIYGYIAFFVFLVIVFFGFKKYKTNTLFIGFLWFTILISPALLVPKSLNDQTFEHRLYLPFVGILFLIGSLVLRWTEQSKKKFYLIIALVVSIFTVINFSRQKAFANDIVFWEDAVSGSPDNAYAHMLLGVRYTQKNKLPEAYIQFQKAYAINPSERYLNHYMGLMFLNNKKPDTSINYFEKDIELNGLHDSHFHLARAYFETGNKSKAIAALEKYIVLRPNDAMANNNLMLLYSEIGNREKLNSHIHQMQLMGMQVPTEILQQVGQ
jgi:hypothetical protein